jgi:hypothetical protein
LTSAALAPVTGTAVTSVTSTTGTVTGITPGSSNPNLPLCDWRWSGACSGQPNPIRGSEVSSEIKGRRSSQPARCNRRSAESKTIKAGVRNPGSGPHHAFIRNRFAIPPTPRDRPEGSAFRPWKGRSILPLRGQVAKIAIKQRSAKGATR